MTVAGAPHSGLWGRRIQQVAAAAALFAVGAAIALGCRRQAGAQSKPATYINGTAAVWDGDSLTVRAPVLQAASAVLGQAGDASHSGTQVQGRKVRLFAIDAPELLQTCTDARGRSYDCGGRPAFALGPARSRLRKGRAPSAHGGRRQGGGGRAAGAGGQRVPELRGGARRPLQEERGALHARRHLLPARRRPRRVAAGERARAGLQVRAGLPGASVSCSVPLQAPALLASTCGPGQRGPDVRRAAAGSTRAGTCATTRAWRPRRALPGAASGPAALCRPGSGARTRAGHSEWTLSVGQAHRLAGHVDFTGAVHGSGRCTRPTKWTEVTPVPKILRPRAAELTCGRPPSRRAPPSGCAPRAARHRRHTRAPRLEAPGHVTALLSLRPRTGTSLQPLRRSVPHSCLGHGRTDERAVPHKP